MMLRAILFFALASMASPGASARTIEPKGFDSPSLAAAIQQAQPGETVRLPAGTFELTEPVRPRSGIKLLGAGQDETRLISKAARPGVLISLTDCEDVELAHMTLDGQNNPLLQQGISGSNARRLWLHHLTIRNLKARTWGPHAILFSGNNPTMEGGVTDSRITDCQIENIGLDAEYGGGIRLAWGSARNQVLDNVIHNTGRGGIFGDHSPELIVRRNRVTGSGGVGLGIELWGGCPRSLIEDNVVDHWLSVDQGPRVAVRRNRIGTDDGSVKFIGIEIIARDVVVTDNEVRNGCLIGLSVSNRPVKNNVYWGHNTIQGYLQFGAQLQGETGGIAHHYFHDCIFEDGVRGDPRARYPRDSGHGFRINGACRGLVFENCAFRNNGGYGVQLGGKDVDALRFVQCDITGNRQAAVSGPAQFQALEFVDCRIRGNQNDRLPENRPFPAAPPVAQIRLPASIRAGEPAGFACASRANDDAIVERLWDFGEGLPETSTQPRHTYSQPGTYRVTLIVWDKNDQGSRAETTIQVLPGK
jgi:hypothetical protein